MSDDKKLLHEKKRIKREEVEKDMYQMIPSFGRIFLSKSIDVIFLVIILVGYGLVVFDGERVILHLIIMFTIFLIYFIIEFVIATNNSGSTIGMLVCMLFVISETTMRPISASKVSDMLFGRFEVDMMYKDWFEAVALLESPKKQSISMKKRKLIYVNRRQYKAFYQTHKDYIKTVSYSPYFESST